MRFRTFLIAILSALLPAAGATALTITLSSHTSEPATNPAGDLDAEVTFVVGNCDLSSCDVTITLENLTSGTTYDLNQLYFNASFASVGSPDLSYVSATKSDSSVVTGGWTFSEQSSTSDTSTKGDGFGYFDFALIDGVGPSTSQVAPGESIDFLFTGPAGISDSDFFELSQQAPSPPYDMILMTVAVKFVEMDPVGSNTCGDGDDPCDSAYGAAIPEPATALLLLGGLSGLAVAGRRRLH